MAQATGGFSYPITLLCHLLTGGPTCFLIPYFEDRNGIPVLKRRHAECIRQNTAIVIRLPCNDELAEYLVVPMWGMHREDWGPEPVHIFGIFKVSVAVGEFMLNHVLRCRRLPVVFDLDETLLQARLCNTLTEICTPNNLQLAINEDRVPNSRYVEKRDPRDVEAQYNRVKTDIGILACFQEQDEVLWPDRTRQKPQYIRSPFYVLKEDGQVVRHDVDRPVVVLNDDTILTRLVPSDKGTSMIFRLRPRWRDVYARLTGECDVPGFAEKNPKPIVQAYVCTTGRFYYAQEAWRALDPEGKLIPSEQWPERINADVKADDKEKKLAETLRLKRAGLPTESILPFVVIVENEPRGWEDSVKNQIYHMPHWGPMDHYRRFSNPETAGKEMLALGGMLCCLHSTMFAEFDRLLRRMKGGNTLREALDFSGRDSILSCTEDYKKLLPTPPFVQHLLPAMRQQSRPLEPIPLDGPRPPLQQQPIVDNRNSQRRATVEVSAVPAPALEMNNGPSSSAVDAINNSNDMLQQSWESAGFVTVNKRKMDAAHSVGGDMKPLSKNALKKLKRQASADQNPVIVLSRYAQEKGKHLVYERAPIGELNDEWIVLVKLDGKRIGQGNGNSVEDGDKKAAITALEELKMAPWYKASLNPEKQVRGDDEGNGNGAARLKAPPDGSQYITAGTARDNLFLLFPLAEYKIAYKPLTSDKVLPLRLMLHVIKKEERTTVEEMEGLSVFGKYADAKDDCALKLLKKLGYVVRP